MKAQGFDYVPVDPAAQQVGPPSRREPNYDRAALATLQREEVTMVAADLRCEKQHITAVEEKVRAEYERDFRERNADLLAKVPAP